jgi:dipeptidyl aminopeptidase/acylaminoacyl peptidase
VEEFFAEGEMMRTAITTIVLLALCAALTATAQQRRPVTIEDMGTMKRIAAPALSPDGKWVAYTLTTPDVKANKSSSDVWISSVDGKVHRQLTTNTAADRNPVWSPDGSQIAFESSRSGENQIWLISVSGGEPRQFTTLATGASQAVWSPDGSQLAYVSEVFPEYSSLSFKESDAKNKARLEELESGKIKAQTFTRLLYRHWDSWVEGKRQHIFLQPLASGEPRDLTPGDRDAVPSSSTFSAGTDFAFSPDGKEIAYTATPLPIREEAWNTNHDIYTIALAGGTPRQITTNPAADGYPRYSPDGKYIAYRAQERPGFEGDRWQLMVFDRKTGVVKSLTSSFDAAVGTPVWAPDSRKLYFDAEERARTPIFSVSIAGNDVRKVVDGKSNHDISIDAKGSFLVFGRVGVTRPVEIFTAGVDGKGLRPVTGVNDAVFANLVMPEPEDISWTGAGGTRVQGWLHKPPMFDPAKKYPLILMIHGGPQGAWADGWSYRWNPVLWAAQGYVVLAPNPRGSTGFGQKFTDEISGDWGGKVYIDLMNGLDTVSSFPYIDSTRRAAAGASFGGYMVNWLLGHAGEKFRAFVTHDGVYNFESMYGSTDEVWFDEWDHSGAPWEKPESYRHFSPHVYAKNFRTPTLVIHGALDYRIPYTEAMQLFTALQRQNVPSKFLYFPDENHWVLKPGNSELWHRTVFGWLAEYLR